MSFIVGGCWCGFGVFVRVDFGSVCVNGGISCLGLFCVFCLNLEFELVVL